MFMEMHMYVLCMFSCMYCACLKLSELSALSIKKLLLVIPDFTHIHDIRLLMCVMHNSTAFRAVCCGYGKAARDQGL